jgi:NAD(P)-dependent dehydrogenase (short-subunit alcohol dehydrogenase family)
MHKELATDGFTVISLDPGWNRTDMGGSRAPLDPKDTVRGMVTVMERLGRDDSGKFLGYERRDPALVIGEGLRGRPRGTRPERRPGRHVRPRTSISLTSVGLPW